MNFFKPNKTKIIIFVLVILLAFLSLRVGDKYAGYCIYGETGTRYCERPSIGEIFGSLYAVLNFPAAFIKEMTLGYYSWQQVTHFFNSMSGRFLMLAVDLAWFYFIACLAFGLFTLLKKQFRPKKGQKKH